MKYKQTGFSDILINYGTRNENLGSEVEYSIWVVYCASSERTAS